MPCDKSEEVNKSQQRALEQARLLHGVAFACERMSAVGCRENERAPSAFPI